MASREEDELQEIRGSKPVYGEDPRFSDGDGVWVNDNDASQQIEDLDVFDPVQVENNPFTVWATDEDGHPGFRPYVDASNSFEQQEGLENPPEPQDSPDSDVLGDEFVDRLNQRAAAEVDDLGRPRGDLAMLTHSANAAQASTEAIAGHVRISPPSAYTALMGGNAQVFTNGPTKEVARWEGASDVEAQPVTIAVSRVAPNPDSINGPEAGLLLPFRPFAIVQWGTRNAAISVVVDIGAGTQFTIAATAVNVQVGMGAVPPRGATPAGSLELAGQLAFWTVLRTTPVTTTVYYDSVNVEGVTDIIVPQFAKRVWLFRSDDTQAYSIDFQDSQTNSIYMVTMAAGAFQTSPILLAGDIYFLHIGTGPGNLEPFRVVFELSL